MEIGRKETQIVARIAINLSLMVAGACATIFILKWRGLIAEEPARDIASGLMLTFFVLSMWSAAIDPKRPEVKGPSPRVIAAIVVVATGLTAAGVLFWNGWSFAASIVLVVTWAATLFVWRFAGRHAGEIGEARFRGE